MIRFLLVADCRTGGTNLIRALGTHSMLETRGEKMLEHWMQRRVPNSFSEWLERSFDDCNGWHLQRYQLPYDHEWTKIRVPIINLYREDTLGQWVSFQRALMTGEWENKTRMPEVPFDPDAYMEHDLAWRHQRIRCRRLLSDNQMLDVTFERLVSDWRGSVRKILEFLGVQYEDLKPVLSRELQQPEMTGWHQR